MKIEPEKIENPINFKILLSVIGISILFFLLLNLYKDTSRTILDITYFIGPLVISITSFLVARLYWDSEIFGKAYIAMSAAFLMLVFGEITGNIYLITEIGYLEYLISGFYFMYFPFIIYHLIKNIQFFSPNGISRNKILFLMFSPLIITLYFYSSISNTEELQFLVFDVIELHVSIFILELGIFGIFIFRNNILKTTWVLIAIGVTLDTIADIGLSYDYVFLSNEFNFVHPYNVLWITGFMIIMYALIKHKQAL